MKASIYFNYTTRSLVRGGQRTLLAIFCVAVGVMAIVSLQLVGIMVNSAFTSNVRDANGGDVTVTSQNKPFKQSDLSYFDSLKLNGKITQYTPTVNAQGTISVSASLRQSFTVRAVNPATYPVVTPPTFTNPKDGTLSGLLSNGQAIATQSFIDQYHKKVGDSFDIHIGSQQQTGRTIHVKLVGIVSETGVLTQAGSVVLIALNDYAAADPNLPVLYNTINVATANASKIKPVAKNIKNKFFFATTQTPADALKSQQSSIDNIKNFLEISGLLALFIV